MSQTLSPKDITSSFVQQGYYLRPKALQTLKIFLKQVDKVQGKILINQIISSVYTVIQSNQELSDGQFVDSLLIEHALKLLPTTTDGAMQEEGDLLSTKKIRINTSSKQLKMKKRPIITLSTISKKKKKKNRIRFLAGMNKTR